VAVPVMASRSYPMSDGVTRRAGAPRQRPSVPGTCLAGCLLLALPGAQALAAACPIVVPSERFDYRPASGPQPPADTAAADARSAPLDASADRLTSRDGVVTLDGNATLSWQDNRITTDSATYRRDTGELNIDGALTLEGPGISLRSERADLDIDDERLVAGRTEYRIDLEGRRATGAADRLASLPGGRFELEGATYSTCPPDKLDWYIRTDRLSLDTDSGIGVATGISLRFKGVPIFALPAFSFPIGTQRKTGFLSPAIARSNDTGLELLVPWYWNLRPELDATFTARLMQRRGLQLQSEARYLNTQGDWTLNNEVLRDRALGGDWRHFTRLQHRGAFSERLTSRVDISNVSDSDYFDDLGSSLRRARTTHLERVAEIVYENHNAVAFARLQGFQTVDLSSAADGTEAPIEDRPYLRVPQLGLTTRAPVAPLGLQPTLEGEFVYFDRRDSVIGARLDVLPRLSLPLGGEGWFFTPSTSHRFTLYQLEGAPLGIDESVVRSTNTFSLDTGLFFDRRIGTRGTVQTIEPRLYYLKVPYVDQDRLPVFDASAFDFDFAQLFRENRYSGADRVADADQLSLALTTRIVDGEDGRETLRASIGQILYFADNRVNLPPTSFEPAPPPDERDRSDLVGEVATRFDRAWLARGLLQWNADRNETVRGSFLLSYRPDEDRVINLGHRIVNTGSLAETEQLDLSIRWPISDAWRISARWNHSLDADVSLENLIGIEYDSCCYALRFAARRYIADDNEDHDTSVYLQLVLKGLAPLGQNYGRVLENAIPGYEDEY